MVSIGSSFTIVGNNNFFPINEDSPPIITNQDVETEKMGTVGFIPPHATWYDETHQHFVALTDQKQQSQHSKINDSSLQSGEVCALFFHTRIKNQLRKSNEILQIYIFIGTKN